MNCFSATASKAKLTCCRTIDIILKQLPHLFHSSFVLCLVYITLHVFVNSYQFCYKR